MSLLNPLNPAAGGVPVPEDRREIEAALRAGVISYRIFPYLEWRYGERGQAFTKSDSAWLAWLTRHSHVQVQEQIDWLRHVLSNRGMPTWILEVHLRVLYRELIRTIPNQNHKYASLLTNANRLRAVTQSGISPQRRQVLIADFTAAVGPVSSVLVTHAARLLVSALADEKSGVKNAVTSLEVWLADVPKWRGIALLRKRLATKDLRILDSDAFAARWQHALTTVIAQAHRK